jgi:hypothetical protein
MFASSAIAKPRARPTAVHRSWLTGTQGKESLAAQPLPTPAAIRGRRPAANFPAAFSTSPASRVSGVVLGRAAEASGLMPRDLNKSLDDRSTTRSKNVINFVSLGPAQAIAIKIGRGGAR